ncbi:hypothetical protein BBO99_00005199 [Phytophthora kernoviae]|uniref:Transmembrane protein 184C n=2 Tax=Phytophthora kernoviae TaxID=325452 RepID=A0A3F2RPN6_9STRA|nr:hypothetical protein G195_005476 [Phytophthora kernoviae 00238/432]KAG2524015.1 hypothetical protein JM16_004871 [Phytophthora kernoviae]KAG2525761.1 hypothetical protein JM18_004729 [Phytophthora kernoviae]RLN06281.1 hypothetical protein BBI17_005191 [Phytophthora kernoviae]RLN61832.1 hypothetical protein BBP00_00005154 [Phytophthora kernoviae]
MQLQTLAYAISGAFTLLAIVLSGWLIWTHLLYNPSAGIRKHVIRILMMVPIYALTSYMALVFNESKLLFETVRDCYEAFALYSFHCFLVEYLGGQSVLASTMRSKPEMNHVFPFCCMQSWAMGAGVYGEGELMNPFVSYGYVCLILSVSQTWALYCLLIFFHGAHEELQPMRPWPKFLAIKAIIFFTYWQSILISMLASVGVISEKWHIGCPDCWDAQKIVSALNDFIICVEMLGFAIAHHYAFAIEDFLSPSGVGVTVPSSNVKAPLLANFMDAINVTDVSTDLKNSRNEILTKKQALAAKFERFNSSSPGGGMF